MDTFTGIIDSVPKKINNRVTPAGAICGNGDVACVLENDEKGAVLCVSKCDFWKCADGGENDGGIKSVCKIEISDIDLLPYHVEQRMAEGCVYGKIGQAELNVFVAPSNVIYLGITAPDTDSFPEAKVTVSSGCGAEVYAEGDVYIRRFTEPGLREKTGVAVCKKELFSAIENGIKTVRYCFAVVTNFDDENYAGKSAMLAEKADYDADKAKTGEKWQKFFGKSDVILEDKKLELFYHSGLYLLACCMGNKRFPPGLYGNYVTNDDFPWHGDYHLNYNYEAPFYALSTSNHAELIDCYMAPLAEFMPDAQKFAKDYLGCRGVYYPVGIGPLGLDLSAVKDSKEHGRLFLGQKSNAAYAAVIPVMRWYAHYDTEYAKAEALPFLLEVAAFWESYLKKENGRYVICDDAVHEVPFYRGAAFNERKYHKQIHAKNNILSIGLVKMLFECLLDMAEHIEIPQERQALWRDILGNISDYKTFIRNGRRCYRYTEKGIAWVKGNSLCIQHIYPASTIGLFSDKKTLKIARNTYLSNDRRLDDNGSVSYLPCGARLGVSSEFLLRGLHDNIEKFALPNMLFAHGGGCLEHCTTIPATVNEMLLQSLKGVIRLFPCPFDGSAQFRDLRAQGAFLVSAKRENGIISGVCIKSEKGRLLKLDISGMGDISVTDSSGKAVDYVIQNGCAEIRTEAGETYCINR